MANRYANLVGSNKIKDEYTKINQGFDKVQQDMDAKPDRSIAQVNDVQMGTDDTLTIEGSTGITISTNPSQKKVTITATGTSTPGPHGPSHNNDGADPIPDLQNLTNEFDAHKADEANPHNVTSEQINTLPNDSMQASDTYDQYPNGVTVVSYFSGIDQGFPAQHGTLSTFRGRGQVAYTRQEFVQNNPFRKWERAWAAGPGQWYDWVESVSTDVIKYGSGSPEGVVAASPGSLYRRIDTGELWVKKTGAGNTGWGQVAVS